MCKSGSNDCNDPSTAYDDGVGISFENISYSVKTAEKKGKKSEASVFTIIDGLSGTFVPGKLSALMGPSGSGKSTLLDILAGRKNTGTLQGQVLFNGERPTRDDYRSIVGYVEQFDTLVGELTVEKM
jgi:ABC-type multidrug transport system ATPase subunit